MFSAALRSSKHHEHKFFVTYHDLRIPYRPAATVLVIFTSLASSWLLVYGLGSKSGIYVEIFYVPVLLGAVFFGVPGGLLTAVTAGILCGPYLLQGAHMVAGHRVAWLSQTGFFVLVGSVGGALFDFRRRQHELQRDRERRSVSSGLPNQVALEQDLNSLLAAACLTPGSGILVAEVGLVNLDEIIATFGRKRANEFVCSIGHRLQRDDGFFWNIYHTYTDRFALLVKDDDARNIADFCGQISGVVQKTVEIDSVPLGTGARIGIARYPTHGETGAELLRAARFALRAAEAEQKTYAVFNKGDDEQHRHALEQLGALRRGIECGELLFHYQPKLDLRTSLISSVEALVRWRHPSGELMVPGLFLPYAENTAVITQLSAWGLKTAIMQISEWARKGTGLNLRIAVNLSAMDLQNGITPQYLKELLQLYNVNPTHLEIEVTETTVINDLKAAMNCLEQIKALGVRVAIDDFGTGHAGLAQLRDLPADSLKIDQTFVAQLLKDPKADVIVRSTIDLAHDLGLEAIAEGVENGDVLRRVREYGCDVAQGYGIALPMTVEDLERWLPKRGARLMVAGRSKSKS